MRADLLTHHMIRLTHPENQTQTKIHVPVMTVTDASSSSEIR